MLDGFKSLHPDEQHFGKYAALYKLINNPEYVKRLGKKLDLCNIKCSIYLLAGERDDITPKEEVFNAEEHLGTDKREIVKDIANGGHVGLFM